MRFHLRCTHLDCAVTCWVRGDHEFDTNATVIDDNDPMEDACEHIKAGDYEIVDSEAIDDFYDL